MKRTWKAMFFILLSLSVSAVLAVAAHNNSNSTKRRMLHSRLELVIHDYNDGITSYIDISQITDFSWDHLYVYGRPYLQCDFIREDIGDASWRDCESTGIGVDGDISLIIFTKNKKVVQYLVYSSYWADFSTAEKTEGYLPEESRFVLNKDDQVIWVEQE